MKFLFKVFSWRISCKLEKLGDEEKVKFLLGELVKAVQDSGKELVRKSDGFGSLSIWMHNCNRENAMLKIENIKDGWEIATKPNFRIKENANG